MARPWLTAIGSIWCLLASQAAASGQAAAHGPLRIHVAYPAPGAALEFGDSTFLFGTVGDGRATLSVAGQSVKVAHNGAWLAWVALPRDSSFSVRIVARTSRDSATLSLPLLRAAWVRESGAWIDRNSLRELEKNIWMPVGESLPLTLRAAPDAAVRLLLPDGKILRFTRDTSRIDTDNSAGSIDHEEPNVHGVMRGERYVALLQGSINPNALPWDSTASHAHAVVPVVEVVLNGDTTRVPWNIEVTRSSARPLEVVLGPPPPHPGVPPPVHLGGDDKINIGRDHLTGAYTWFFPTGTHSYADMRVGDQVRLRLSPTTVAWVQRSDVRNAYDDLTQVRGAIVALPVLAAEPGFTRVRIPMTQPTAMRVGESDRTLTVTLYHAYSLASWTRAATEQRFAQLVSWKRESNDQLALVLKLDRPLWGWRVRIEGTDLIVDLREPPAVNATRPLRGRLIAVDPGHPPGGACGPTGLCESEVNLNVAMAVQKQLEARGARVILTRSTMRPVALWPRVALADSMNAELLVSIHNNAFPDGINPFTNHGTSTFFNHEQSRALARAVQSRLVANLQLPDLGALQGDFALVRPTWYPAILTEGLHMMFPDQEALLRTPAGIRRYAAGVVEGITAFLHDLPRTPKIPVRP